MPYKPNKSLGQNFLLERTVPDSMVLALELKEGDTVVEIGAGLGALTVPIVNHLPVSTHVYAVEIDERFIQKLESMFEDVSNIRIVHADVMEWFQTFNATEGFKVIGSLPYNITSPIVHMILKKVPQPDTCVLLVQKEVAEKIASGTGDACYLSSFVQSFYDVTYIGSVSKDLFDPSPKVDGGIIKMVRKASHISYNDVEKYEGFLHRAFSHPRKMLNKPFSREELEKANIDGRLRPQNITPERWIEIFKTLSS